MSNLNASTKVYAVYDYKNDRYSDFCFANSDEDAKRIWKMTIDNEMVGNPIYSFFPEDFALFTLCTVDNSSGLIAAEVKPKKLFDFSDLKGSNHD